MEEEEEEEGEEEGEEAGREEREEVREEEVGGKEMGGCNRVAVTVVVV